MGAAVKISGGGGEYTDSLTVPLSYWNNKLSLVWGAFGKNEDDWWLGTTTITITASKSELTEFSRTFSEKTGERNIRIIDTNGSEHVDYITTNFDLAELKKAGYKNFSIVVKFDMKGIYNADSELWIRKGHGLKGKEWYYWYWDHGGGGEDRYWGEYTKSGNVSLSDWDNNLSLVWGARGKSDDDWWLGATTITITAVK